MQGRNKLPRKTSLKKKADIDRLLKAGQRISGDYFSLVWEKSPVFQCGILVSGKYGPAVSRNRLKRLIREAVRLNRKMITEPVSIAVLPKPNVGEPDFDVLDAEFKRVFKLINGRS